jgi:hypothetical protein
MTMPIPQAFTFVVLGNDDGTNNRDQGYRISQTILTGTTKPRQPDFIPYTQDFTTYPNELVFALMDPPSVQAISLQFYGDFEATFTCPTDVVTEYDPTNPDPVPDPNGSTLDDSHDFPDQGRGLDNQGGDVTYFFEHPRYYTDNPYDYVSSQQTKTPQSGDTYQVNSAQDVNFGLNGWSINFTVQNGDSVVLNGETDEYEYYPFSQETTIGNCTAKFRPDYNEGAPFGNLCCPIKDAVISGKASIWSVSVTGERTQPDDPGYNGVILTVGDDYVEEQVLDWSFTFDPANPTPTTYEIPKFDDRISFINDWWIESITPPAP